MTVETDTSIKEIENEMSVREVMTMGVFSIDIEANVPEVAREMGRRKVGSILVTKNNVAVGIITERDMVRKIISKDIIPCNIPAGEIMSSPLITAKPLTSVIDAARLMTRSNIRRLAVMDNGTIVGIITNRDILTVSSGLSAILTDLIKMNREQNSSRTPELESGICEYCSASDEKLMPVNGLLLCESCKGSRGYY